MNASVIDFPPYRLDLLAWQLRRDGEPVALRPKTLAVLRYLAERPGELVRKQQLLDAIWPDVAVSEDVVRISAGEIRAALGDDRAAPRFIETVPGLGYRFVAKAVASSPPTANGNAAADPLVVGRTRERARILEWMRAASGGRRQLVFVTGETGIGKTTLVDTALRELAHATGTTVRIARGQCIEQFGGGEPYRPVLEAIAALCRGPDGAATIDALRASAPRWLMRAVAPSSSRPTAAEGGNDLGYEHTLHMLASTVERLATVGPLVLVFEDVHWSDYSTLDLLSLLAQGRQPARLLMLCTLRPADAIARGHPLTNVKRELLRKGQCSELLLGGLSATDVERYLAARFPDRSLPDQLLALLVERSDGNPFFVVTLIDHLLESGALVAEATGWRLGASAETLRAVIPDGLRAVIEPRLERLTSDERRVLAAAAIAGPVFPAHAITGTAPAGSAASGVEVVEALCDGLAGRHEIVRAIGEQTWPDGTTSARYAFRHALFQQVLTQQLAPSLRRRLHQTIGERLEAGYRGRTGEVASELAAHFERSGDVARAVHYHGEAAARARARFAHQETRLHVESALRLIRGQPETADGTRRRMPMLDDLAWAAFASRGWGNEDAKRSFAEMREIAERLDSAEARFKAMEGELVVHTMRAEYDVARRRGTEMLRLAEQIGNRAAVLGALPPIGAVLMHVGEVEAAQRIAERGRTLANVEEPTIHSVACATLLASALAHRGRIGEARAMNDEAVALATASAIPYVRAHAVIYAATIHQLLRDVPRVRSLADDGRRIASELGFEALGTLAVLYGAWCDVQTGRLEALQALRSAFDAYVASGQRISTSSYGLLVVEGHLAAGDVAGADAMLDVASSFASETGERLVEHEIHRLRGECRVAAGDDAAAVAWFERAIVLAESQDAGLFHLRAAISLARVRPRSDRGRIERLLEQLGPEDDYGDRRDAMALLGR